MIFYDEHVNSKNSIRLRGSGNNIIIRWLCENIIRLTVLQSLIRETAWQEWHRTYVRIVYSRISL